jgi:aquaporin Z
VCLIAAEIAAPAEFNVPLLIIGEFVYTFALCYVVLLTTRTENSYFGLAIGSTVTVGALAAGAVCLTAFNPAVAIELGIMQIAMWKFAAITIAANLAAAAAAACVVKIINAKCNVLDI